MLPLVVRDDRLQTKESTQHVFKSSPVRIGRNKLNDLPLEDPFVSLWHGMLQFDDVSIQYLDLASTNGSELNGQRAQPNTLIPLGAGRADLLIGPLRLHLSRGEGPLDVPEKRSMSPLRCAAASRRRAGLARSPGAVFQAPSPTLYWQEGKAPSSPPISATAMPAPTLMPATSGAASAGVAARLESMGGRSFSEETWPATTANALLPRYMKYRDAWDKLNKQLMDAIAGVPVARRARALQLLQGKLPTLGQEREFRALLSGESAPLANVQVPFADPSPGSAAVGAGVGSQDTHPGTRPIPGAFAVPASPSRPPISTPAPEADGATMLDIQAPPSAGPSFGVGGRGAPSPGCGPSHLAPQPLRRDLRAGLEAHCPGAGAVPPPALGSPRGLRSGLHPRLRRGQEEFNKQMAISPGGTSSLRLGSGTARDILRQLLETGPDAPARIRDLTGGFADVMVHQVALLSGIREGVGALLGRLNPSGFTGEGSRNRLTSTLTGPLRPLLAWKRYVTRYQELTEEERATEGVLFGPEFAFAYARIVGGPLAGKKQPSRSGSTPPVVPSKRS